MVFVFIDIPAVPPIPRTDDSDVTAAQDEADSEHPALDHSEAKEAGFGEAVLLVGCEHPLGIGECQFCGLEIDAMSGDVRGLLAWVPNEFHETQYAWRIAFSQYFRKYEPRARTGSGASEYPLWTIVRALGGLALRTALAWALQPVIGP